MIRTRVVFALLVLAACGPDVTTAVDGTAETPEGQLTDSARRKDAGHATDAGASKLDAGGGNSDAGSAGVDAGGAPLDGGSRDAGPVSTGGIKKVFVIAMENQGTAAVYNGSNAPFINNTLFAQGGHASMYGDVLPSSIPSEPHYVWLEAGTNVFSDHTFTNDKDASNSNSTASTQHLVSQMAALPSPKTWRAYQEGLNASTGACPISSNGEYAAKHDPFVFFTDVAGNPPSKTNSGCAAHHKAFTLAALQSDLETNDVAEYTFITPNLCNDMHGGAACSNGCLGSSTIGACVTAGDAWLASVVPTIKSYIDTHDGILLIIWDEPQSSGTQPFVVIGKGVKTNYTSDVAVTHSSYLKSLQKVFGVPVFANVATANDFSDFFEPGAFP